ncbi:YsnF/AvaK domain-containing protein [Paracraurococcus lichenis]|uniref:YsnF/AvaK domain-containing protein n=1 Tax=Paracraurococcus lichenis TaxID=3064888 RepID=A0ABT9DT80_9PROT|nr:YsnF/AvaK domain-containing protein [Paracraurococcus sp. LOR1-02]MDO9707109.1 YsnF/AvaK domain-containing protein [Paracraurococcus sp. LOR1-02]
MTRTITAYFDTVQEAERAAYDLAQRVPGVRGEVFNAQSDQHRLQQLSLPQDDLETVNEGFRRGGGIVHAEVPDGRFEEVASVLESSGAADLDQREASWRQEGWTGGGARPAETAPLATGTSTVDATASGRATSGTAANVQRLGAATDEASIPIVEERLRVGKRETGHGRVRIRSYVVETPVQEQVTLREEHVQVERRPVDRPLTGKEAVFQDRTVEATERAEEAVVSKEARVTEEVSLRKSAEERTETIRDTVRRTEVEVEDERKAGAAGSGTAKAAREKGRDI